MIEARLGREKLLTLLDEVVRESSADETEVRGRVASSALTRFANSEIHQNVAEETVQVTIRVRIGKALGSASVGAVTPGHLKDCLKKAIAAAELGPDSDREYHFPGKAPRYPEVDCFDEATATAGAGARAEAVVEMVEVCDEHGVEAFGNLTTGWDEIAVVNSNGVRAYTPTSTAVLNLSTIGGGGTGPFSYGYSGDSARMLSSLDIAALARESAGICVRNRDPQDFEPGLYDVILTEYAAADILTFLGYVALGGTAFEEGRSFMSGRLGDRIMGENIDIFDDGTDLRTMAMPFDWAGVPKRKVPLISKGVAKGVVYDAFTAQKYGRENTGHGLPGARGGIPAHIILAPGESSLDEMISGSKRAILVNRFHYTRVAEPMKVVITGMTRDGTFLVEDGEIKHPIKNLRFTQSYLEAMNNVEAIGSALKIQGSYVGSVTVPALKIRDFNFTGTTSF